MQWKRRLTSEDGRKDARNMLRNNWLTIKSLIVASSWSHIYLLIKDARSLEHKVILSFMLLFLRIKLFIFLKEEYVVDIFWKEFLRGVEITKQVME